MTFRGVVLGKGQEGALWDAEDTLDLDARNGGYIACKYGQHSTHRLQNWSDPILVSF